MLETDGMKPVRLSHPHPAKSECRSSASFTEMTKGFLAIPELYAERCVREALESLPFHLDNVVFRQGRYRIDYLPLKFVFFSSESY